MSTTQVTLGTQFRHVIADCHALWEVTGEVGDDIYKITVVDEPFEIGGEWYPSDYAGHTIVMRGSDIRSRLAFQDVCDRQASAHDLFCLPRSSAPPCTTTTVSASMSVV